MDTGLEKYLCKSYQLYLAIKQSTYENFFQLKAITLVVLHNQLLLMVVDVEIEVIIQWINVILC
ncbi:MAG: element excision factor XisH family protein [Nostoc sp.]|uniref:element excision factor XisH family protein n=1 Tax=Nostoc sp. TaxID=1180 RepID=UPI002FF447F9